MSRPLASMEVESEALSSWIKNVYLPTVRNYATPKAVRRIGFLVLKRVILLTPADTGRARAGWGVAARALGGDTPRIRGKPEEVFDPAKGWRPGSFTEQTSGARVSIELVNAVTYIGDLDAGTSKQAPYGILIVAARAIQRDVPDDVLAFYNEAWNTGGSAGERNAKGQFATTDVMRATGPRN